jgi:signal transduction histidine kinase
VLFADLLPLMDEDGHLRSQGSGRTPGGSLWSDAQAVVPFEIGSRDEGVLRLGRTGAREFDERDVESAESLAHVLGVAIASRRARAALAERVKELTCMYGIAQIAARPGLGLDGALREIVGLLPAAWQYPEMASARIVLDDRAFSTPGFASGPRGLSADIKVEGKLRGRVEVVYADPGEKDTALLFEDEPFLEEERHLIDGVARELTTLIGRRETEEEAQRLQEQIRHADRLATIGELAAGVAHELNEPLGNILGFAQLAGKSEDLPDQTRQDLEKIVTASLYAREIIKKLMFFSRQAPAQKVDVDVNGVVEDVMSLLRPRCEKGGVAVEVRLAPRPPVVRGDAAQLQQVLVNLVVNAIQAMPEGGTLRLQTTADDEAVRVAVADSGVGIPPENVQRIFMPFFTTKDVGEGTGLGLAVVHGIVTLHGGAVQAESEVGAGTRFEVRLPAAGASGEDSRDAD